MKLGKQRFLVMRILFLTVLLVLLSACSSSVKDYSAATPLTDFKTDLKVKRLWLKEVGQLTKRHNVQLTPAVADNVLYFANTDGRVGALGADRGRKHWEVKTREILTGGPAAGQGLLVLGTREAEILALDQRDGAVRWRSQVGAEMLATPRLTDGQVILQTIDGKVIALDVDSGNQLWSYSHTIPALTLRGTSAPLILGQRVLAGFADGKLVSLELKTGKLQWSTSIAVPRGRTDLARLVDIDGLFAASGDTVYVSSFQGNIAAVSVGNGETLWSREISSYTGLNIVSQQIVLSDSEGLIWALDTRNGGTLWRQDKLKGREPGVPVVVEHALAIGDFEGYVHWLALDDGRMLARQSLGYFSRKADVFSVNKQQLQPPWRSVSAVPQTQGKRLYVLDNLGTLAAFELMPPMVGK